MEPLPALCNDMANIMKWGNDILVGFNQGKTAQVFISRKHHPDFPPVFMNGNKLDISTSITQLDLSVSSILTWKSHIHSIAKHDSQKLGFLLTIYKHQIPSCLEYCSHVWVCASKSFLFLLDKVRSKVIRLINNPNLANFLQSLSHLVADLSIFNRYFHGY